MKNKTRHSGFVGWSCEGQIPESHQWMWIHTAILEQDSGILRTSETGMTPYMYIFVIPAGAERSAGIF